MKNLVKVILLAGCLLISPMHIMAEENPTEPIVINDEQTPEARKKESKNHTYYYAAAFLIIIACGVVIINQKEKLTLDLDSIEPNGDGSYIVSFGYRNTSRGSIKYDTGEFGFKILKGNAILLKNEANKEFLQGEHKNSVIAVINEDSIIEFCAGEQKIIVNGKELKDREEQ